MDRKLDIKITLPGAVWSVGWLFTIGFAHLSFWQGLVALFVWPYYLGAHLG